MFLVSAIFKDSSETMLMVCEVTSYNHAQYPVLIRKIKLQWYAPLMTVLWLEFSCLQLSYVLDELWL